MSHDLLHLVAEYKRLDKKRIKSPLTAEEQERWTLLNVALAQSLGKAPAAPAPTASAAPPAAAAAYTRSDLRVEAELEASFLDHASVKQAFIKNISGGGLYVETERRLRVGTLLALSIVIKDPSQRLSVVGKVVWANETRALGSRLPPGVGVKFVEIDHASRETIAGIVHEAAERLALAQKS